LADQENGIGSVERRGVEWKDSGEIKISQVTHPVGGLGGSFWLKGKRRKGGKAPILLKARGERRKETKVGSVIIKDEVNTQTIKLTMSTMNLDGIN
jgi:hypothetical protein